MYHKEVALALASQGFRVFPLHAATGCDCGREPGRKPGQCNDKAPRWGGWVEEASCETTWIERSWKRTDYGVAIATGRDFFVLDLDRKGGKDGVASLEALAAGRPYETGLKVISPTGQGEHWYYLTPGDGKRYGSKAGVLGPGIDHRGYSGYVVAPGTRTRNGEYRWLSEGTETPLPSWLGALVPALKERKERKVSTDGVDFAGLPLQVLTRDMLGSVVPTQGLYDAIARVLEGKSWGVNGSGRRGTMLSLSVYLQGTFGPLDPEPSAEVFRASCEAVNAEGVEVKISVAWVADWLADAARLVDWQEKAEMLRARADYAVTVEALSEPRGTFEEQRAEAESLAAESPSALVRETAKIVAAYSGRALGKEEILGLAGKLSRKKDERDKKVSALLKAWDKDAMAAWTKEESRAVGAKLGWALPAFSVEDSAKAFAAVGDVAEVAAGMLEGQKAAKTKGHFDWDDPGNMRRFLRDHGETLRVVSSWNVKGEGPGRWIAYDGKRWAVEQAPSLVEEAAHRTVEGMASEAAAVEDEDLRKAYEAWVRHSRTRGARMTMLADAKASVDLSISHESLDSDPWSLNVANGTLDLKTGALRPHDPSDLMTKLSPVAYDPKAVCPTWEKTLLGSMNGSPEMVGYLQRVLGYCLTGLVTEQALFFAIGEGGNGKGTILNTVLEILGDYATKCPMDMLLATRQKAHETELTMLYRARLALVSETEQGRSWAAAKLKELTGDDPISARRMREDHWTFLPTHKFIVLSNHEPVAHDQSYGMRRRLRCVPFEVSFEEGQRDTNLREKLREELPGILAWAVKGCLAWQAHGLQEPEKVRAAAEAYWERQDTFAQFWEECCTVDGAAPETRREDMIAEYQAWCRLNGDEHPMKPKAFYARVRGVKGVEDKKSNGSRSWSGVALKTRLRGQGTWSPPPTPPAKRPN